MLGPSSTSILGNGIIWGMHLCTGNVGSGGQTWHLQQKIDSEQKARRKGTEVPRVAFQRLVPYIKARGASWSQLDVFSALA